MSIIYSYPETTSLNDNDTLIGTSSALVGGKKKNITRNFSLGEIRDYVSSGGVINPAATDFKLAVFNQNGTKITDSIVSQDALTGTGIVVAGTLRSTAATFNGLITGSQGALIYGGDINLNSTTQLGGPVKDAIGNQGFAGQILLSDSSGRVSWTNYSAGLTYQGTWNAATNTPTLTSGQGVNGHFYIVNVAGNTSLDGETDWKVGDWAVFVEQGVNDKWEKIDNTSVLIGEGTPNTIAMWVGGTTPSTTLNNSIITELNNVISIAGDLSTQGLEVNKYLRDGAGNDGTDGQVLTSTTVNGDKEVVWTTPTTGTVTGSGTGQVLSKFSGTGTGQTVLEDSLVSESSSNSLISGLTKSSTGPAGSIQFQQIGPCNPGGGGQVICVMNDVPNVNLSTDPFSGSGASVVQGITFNFLSTSDADDFKTLYGITNTGMCAFGGGAAASSFDLTLLFDNGATITFNVPQGQVGIACPFNNQVSLGLYREGQNASQYGTALTYVSGSGSISNGDSTVSSIKVSIAATLDMSTNKITNVVDPTDAQDAATKSYVDSTTVSGSGTIGTLPVFTGTDILGDSNYKQSVSGDTVDILTKTVTDANAYTINTNIGKLTRSGMYPNPGALTSNVTIGAQYTYGNVDVHGSNIELHTYNLPNQASSPITLWSSSTAGIGIALRTDGGSITNIAGNYVIQATGAGAGANPEAIQIQSNTGIKFQGQGNAANINFRSYNTQNLDSGDINFISETEEGQAGNITISSIATDAAGTAGEIRLLAEEISTSATDAAPLNLVIGSNGSVQTGSTVTSGTVTSVGYTTDISAFTAAGQPITSSGTLTLNKNGGSTGQYIDGGTGDWVNLPTQDTYTINAGAKSGTSVPLNLDALAGTDSTVNLTEGIGISLTRVSAGEIKIDGVAQGVTGSGTVGKLPKFNTATSLNDSIIEQSGASNLSIDGELSMLTNKITNVVNPTDTQDAATKNYVDNTLAGSGSLIFQGSYDAVNNVPNLTSGTGILKGWTYAVTAGPSTSFWSPPLDVGDLVIANIDNPASASDWTEVQSNIGIAGSGTTDLGTTKGISGFNSNDFTVSSSGWVEAKDFNGSTPGYVPDATGATAGTFLKEDGTWSTAGVVGTGTQNYVTKWSAGGAGIEDSTIFDTGTNVGIGTTSPATALNVRGDLLIEDSAGARYVRIDAPDTGNSFVGRIGTTSSHDLALVSANIERMRITSAGNVGIGTDTPGSLLSIRTASSSGSEDFVTFSRGTSPETEVLKISRNAGDVRFLAEQNITLSADYNDDQGNVRSNIILKTNNVEAMRIDGNGRVGIGTTSPAVSLDISATDAVQMPVGLTGDRPAGVNGMLRYNSSDNEFEGYIDGNWGSIGGSSASGTGTAVSYFDGTTGQASTSLTSDPNIVIDSGYLGVGTNQPNTQLHVKSTVNELLKLESITSSQKIRFTDINNQSDDCDFGSTSGDLAMFTNNFGTSNTQTFTFNKDGKLGINQTLPSYSLDIQDSNFDPAIRIFATNSTSEILLQASQSSGSNNLINSNTNDLDFQGNSSSIMTLGVNTNAGSVTLGQYGQGSKTGSATYNLAVDSVGKIIEVSASSAPSIHKETFLNLASSTFDFLLPVNINPIDENYVNVFIDGIYQNTNNINSVTTNPSNVTTVSLVSAAPAGTNVEIVATT